MVVTVKHVQLNRCNSEDGIQLWSVVVSQHKAATSLSLSRSSSGIEKPLGLETRPFHNANLNSTAPGLVSGVPRLWRYLECAPGCPSGEG